MTRRAVALLLILAACQSASGSERQAGAPSPPSAAGRIIDSLLPIEEEIRRFREAVPEVPASLTGGERSRHALVRRWARALEQRDSAALVSMLINPAEFITFYYPESGYTRPPYRQKPGLRWFLMNNSRVPSTMGTRIQRMGAFMSIRLPRSWRRSTSRSRPAPVPD